MVFRYFRTTNFSISLQDRFYERIHFTPSVLCCSTYDSVEVVPGPRLNVIIGPNGTGKSTIVCAICLGLAGKTSILGRAQNPAEFIKHRRDKAVIEITLYVHSSNRTNLFHNFAKLRVSQYVLCGGTYWI